VHDFCAGLEFEVSFSGGLCLLPAKPLMLAVSSAEERLLDHDLGNQIKRAPAEGS
jgi:hypothetical protein